MIALSAPISILPVVPLAFVYRHIQEYYRRTSRELKRLESTTKSPIFSHFHETLGGLATIRAFKKEREFSHENSRRIDANLKAYFPSISAKRWLGVRLESIGSVILLSTASSAVFSVWRYTRGGGGVGSSISAALVGLAMTYALQITESLNWVIRQTVEAETNIVSVERILELANLPSEESTRTPHTSPPASWPSSGAVTIANFSARYRPGLDLVLKDIALTIRSHEKIGIVGRTGAGKSSLALALLRMMDVAEGHIRIDGLDIAKISLHVLRERLSIIPQDGALFQGNVRENLDPEGVRDDTELWSALGECWPPWPALIRTRRWP